MDLMWLRIPVEVTVDQACEDYHEGCWCTGCRATRERVEDRELADELRAERQDEVRNLYWERGPKGRGRR
jgi:hypothetical protein